MLNHWLEHKKRLHGYIAKQLQDPTLADDILQEVFIKAHGQQRQLQSTENIGAWLFRIAHNTMMDHFRQQKTQQQLSEDLVAVEADQAELSHQQLAQCLEPLINELPEKYQAPLKLAELGNYSQQQVADELGLSLSGAKSRIQRGREKLKQNLTRCCDIEVGRGGVVAFQPKDNDYRDC
ncbi:RNA polymerase sigma factor SigZ [Ferrimonas lipolytica]|uniref:RNA polymerase sigma factor SigZ n=1 Tax=Ferrimonas lipolytica TaxID=2724191 RepID=A0A6H1UAM7_9GAMM|nr:RNA polymerase sigma factor SigZ [Ferrimonas lipolytica]QIZ75689.1 RNA polymerase sigma factor SigZ [Ferrimonas lipolytica]